MLLPHHTVPSERRSRGVGARRAASLALLGLGGIVAYRVAKDGQGVAAVRLLGSVGPLALVAMAAPAVGLFVHMLGWRALLPESLRPTVRKAYCVFIAAQAGNEVGLGLLGEAVKVTSFPRGRRDEALLVVVVDNLVAFAAVFALWATLGEIVGREMIASAVAPLIRNARGFFTSAGAALAAVALASAVGATAVYWSRREAGSMLARLTDGPLRAAALLVRFVRERPGSVLFATAAHYLGKLWLAAEIWLGLYVLGHASLRASAALALGSSGASYLAAPVPAQIGVSEAFLVWAGSAVSITAPTVLALALLRRTRTLIWFFIGAVCAAELLPKSTVEVTDAPTAAR